MEMMCSLIFAVNFFVVFLALLKLCNAYSERGDANEPNFVGANGEAAGGVQHVSHKGRKRNTGLNVDVFMDVLRFSSPDTIDACRLSSRQLDSIVTSLESARPLRSIDFVRIAEHSTWYSEVRMRCYSSDRHRWTGKKFRDFALSEMRYDLRNCYVRRLRTDDPRGESIEKLAGFTDEERCHVEALEMDIVYLTEEADYETIWRAVTALSSSRIHCAFNVCVRRYKCLSSPGFVNAQHVVVEGPMRATERVLRYVMTGRRGSLCWLSFENHADGCYFKEALIEMFQAQTEIGSFEHPLFLQFLYGPPNRWYSEARCIEKNVGLAASEDRVDFRRIARFYPDSKTSFHKHVMRTSDVYKAFVLENASGQRIFVVASDDDGSENSYYCLQQVCFVPDLSILRS